MSSRATCQSGCTVCGLDGGLVPSERFDDPEGWLALERCHTRPPGGHALPVGTPSRWARPPSGHALPVAADEQAEASYLACIPTDRTARALRMLCVGAGRAPAVLPCPACLLPYNKKTLHIQGFLSHNPGSTWDSDENRYAAGRVPGIFESWDQTNAEIPCDAQRWLK